MKNSVIGTILAALALGGVGLLYLRVGELSDEVKSLARRPATQMRAVDGDRALRREGPRASDVDLRSGPRDTPAVATDEERPGAGASADPASAAGARRAGSSRNKTDRVPQPGSVWFPRSRSFARSVDDLGRRLKLSANQKDRVADAVARGKQRIEDILKIPDETGKSPFERRQERTKKLVEALKNRDGNEGHSVFAFASDMFAYQNKKIPGQNSTYGQAIDRIKQETREEIRGTLDPSQAESFDETSIDPLLETGGGAMTISVVQSLDHDGGAGQVGAGVVVESGGAVRLGEPKSGSEGGPEPRQDKD